MRTFQWRRADRARRRRGRRWGAKSALQSRGGKSRGEGGRREGEEAMGSKGACFRRGCIGRGSRGTITGRCQCLGRGRQWWRRWKGRECNPHQQRGGGEAAASSGGWNGSGRLSGGRRI
ncbi:hypothetical protein IEQ34_022292 [Dendrobium chrysotoxum]|uniref:Uncharacterized protein n=1 Tax=Dendrobium chrysotoxum TaxID=161865 RepID=A0AAV7FYL6_DENCH|nr:hypothetical protein IEQ34_022292 [Dendrobium chrysotoxum]